jgi:hypothetical protein
MIKFTACILHRILLKWLNQGWWVGQEMWHAWWSERCLQGFGWEAWSRRPLGRARCRLKYNIKMDLREIEIDLANWIQLAQDRFQCRAFVKTVMNIWFPWNKAGNFLTNWVTVTFSNNILHRVSKKVSK